jgi:hypothetical protein
MMQTAAEMWLAKNAIDCGRYAARMSPKSCEDFRAASPQKCLGCVRMTEEVTAEDLAQAKKGRFVNRSSYSRSPRAAATEKKGSKGMAKKQVRPVAVCVGCGHERPIMGKQKCGSCYGKARRAEKMAAKAPVQPLVQPLAMSAGEGDRIAQPEPSKDGRVILEAPGRSAVIAKRLARLIAVDLPPSSSPPLDGPAIKAIVSSNKYLREIKPGVLVDVYDVLSAWKVTNPALQHLIKKALQAGERGHKSRLEDLDDVVASAVRAREIGNV